MFFVSQSNVINWLISAIPWITKAIGGLFVKTDWEVIIIEIGFWIVSNLISKVLGRNKLKKINKILRKYKNNGYLILKNKFKLNIKYEFLGFKFNIVLFFSNSSLQTFISIIKGDMNKYI